LHLWSTSRAHGDSPSLLCSWWGKDDIPWCCVACLCIHHEKLWFSCCVQANPRSSTSHPLVLSPVGWIVLSVNGIRTLGDVVIVDPIWVDFVSWVTFFRGVVVMMVTKEGLYWNRYLVNLFLLLAFEVFRCLHQEADNFFHRYVNMAWVTKGYKGPLLLVL
jgi:hypothetical protein